MADDGSASFSSAAVSGSMLESAAAPVVESAARRVLESGDLLGLILEGLELTQLLGAARVCRDWRGLVQPELSDEAAAATSVCKPKGAGSCNGAAGGTNARDLSRYALPDAIFPAQYQRGGEHSGARARIADNTATRTIANEAMAASAAAAASAASIAAASAASVPVPPVVDSSADDSAPSSSASSLPLSLLHQRPLLRLCWVPPTLDGRVRLVRSLRHSHSRLRRVALEGPAEALASPEDFLGLLHPRTLSGLEQLSACACLVGQYIIEDAQDQGGEQGEEEKDERAAAGAPLVPTSVTAAIAAAAAGAAVGVVAGLYPTLRRWSLTPLDNSPEHALQHPLREGSLAGLLPMCRSLRDLNVSHSKLWDSSLVLIGSHLHSTLTALNLNFNADITNVGLRALGACADLRELQLQRCWKITPEGLADTLANIAQGFTKKHHPHIAAAAEEAAAAAAAEAEAAQARLVAATMNGSLLPSSLSPDAVASSSPQYSYTCDLRLINLNENRQRGAGCLMALVRYCPLLKHVELSELNLLASTLQTLAAACPKLKYVNCCRVGSTASAPPTPSSLALSAGVGAGASGPSRRLAPMATTAANSSSSRVFAPDDDELASIAAVAAASVSILEVRVTDLSLSYLAGSCGGILKLDLERSGLTNRGLKFLSLRFLPHLRHLSLWQCEEVGDEGLQYLLGMDRERAFTPSTHPCLQFLLLPANKTLLTSNATMHIVTLCTAIRHLVGYVPFASAAQFQQLHANHHRTMRSLSVHVVEERRVGGGGGRLGGEVLKSLLPDFTQLECLDLTVPRLRDSELRVVLRTLCAASTNLKVLKLSHCTYITDDAFNWNTIMDAENVQTTRTKSNAENTTSSSSSSGAGSVSAASVPPPAAAAAVSSVAASASAPTLLPNDGSSNPPTTAAARPPRGLINKPSFGAFVAANSSAAAALSGAATSSAAAASASSPSAALAYFYPHSIGWSCSIELVYLSHCPCVSSRTLLAFAQLPSVRYVDAAACEVLSQEERRIDKIQRDLRDMVDAGTRQPLTLAVHI